MRVFLLFLCYSFLGWACETVYCSIGKRKFVNRGFLNGPLCPVYGFGALAVLYFLRPVSDNIPLLFVSGMVLTSVIEYITGYLLEKLFATKWWDYSSRRFNIHGRVCLRNSLMFGALSVVAVRVIDPVIRGGIYALPATVCAVLSIVFGAMMVADLVVTVRTILDINSALKQLQQMVEQARLDTQEYLRQNQEELQQKMEKAKAQTEERLRQNQQELQQKMEKAKAQTEERLRQNQQELQQKMEQSRLDLELARMELRDFLEQLHSERLERREQRRREFLSRLTPEQQQAIQKLEERMEALSRRNAILRRRLLRAFPEMRSTRYELALERMREALRKKKK